MLPAYACDRFVAQKSKYQPVHGQAKCRTCSHAQVDHSVLAGGIPPIETRVGPKAVKQVAPRVKVPRPRLSGPEFDHLAAPAKAIVAAARADMGVAPPNRKPSDPPGSAPAASSVPSLRTGVPSHWSGDSRPVSSSGCVGSGTPVQAAVAPPPATARGPPQLVRTVLSPPKSGGPGYVYRQRSAMLKKSGPPVDLAIWMAYVVPTWVHEEGPR